jgi:muramidase (phage lysozyme)
MSRHTADELWALYNSSGNFPAWEHVLRHGESYHDDRAWTVRWGGTNKPPKTFTDLSDHPRILEPGPKGPSSAAGAFQITMTTWDGLAYLKLPDFSAKSQRIAMMALTEGRGALDDVLNGRLDEAMRKCRDEWSSLPFGVDGQPTIELAEAHNVFRRYGGIEGTQPAAPIEEVDLSGIPPREEIPMPIPAVLGAIATFGPALAQLIPILAPLFDKKAETPAKLEAASRAIDVVVRTTGAVNEQDAIKKLTESPALVQKATEAVVTDPTIMPMLQISSEGIDKARERNIQMVQSADVWWKLVLNPVLIVTVLTLPLVYIIVWRITDFLAKVSGDVIAQTIGTVIGLVLGGIMGFWMGQTYQNMKERGARTRATDEPQGAG